MAATIYSFEADLTQLLKLNSELERANINLKQLKANTTAYSATAKNIKVMGNEMVKNGKALRGANNQAKALNQTGHRMIAIFKSASIAIVSAFAFRAIIGGIRGVISAFADFESQMAAVKAISGATGSEFKKLEESALKLGRQTIFTARQVAELQEEYARLGFTADEIVAAQAGTIALAAATGESLKSSAETSGAVLRAFGLEAEDTSRIVDIMGASFTSSALNLERFRQSMKFVAPVAKAAGFTFEETSAMLAQLADNGLHGSIAGNALKNIMLRLGDANSKLNKNLGKTVQGLPQFIDALRTMKDDTFGLTEAVDLLDKRSAPAFLALLGNIEGIEDQLDTLNNAEGAVSRMSQIRLDTLEGDFTLLKSATEGLGVAIGNVFNLSLRESIHSLTLWIQGLTESESAMTTIKTVFNTINILIGAMLIKFALLRVAAISQAISIRTLSMQWKRYLVSIRLATAGTRGFNFALQGLKAAIASTGVGLLVIALGTLIGYLMTLKKEINENVMQMNRLHDSFEKDVRKIIELNYENKERISLLRKLNQDYPELIGNIDLEIASNAELVDILGLVNSTRAESNLIKEKQDEIDKIWEATKATEMQHRKTMILEKAERGRILAKTKDGKLLSHIDAKRAHQIDKNEVRLLNEIKRINNKAKREEQIILDDIAIYLGMIEAKKDANATYNKLKAEEDEKFRKVLQLEYRDDLEDFRDIGTLKESQRKKMTKEEIADWISRAKVKQEILLDEAKAEKAFLKKVQEYHALSANLGKGSIQDQKDAKKAYNDFIGVLDKGEKTTLKSHPEALNKVGIRVEELRTKITNLSSALIRSGAAADNKSAISVHKLNKTKERIKELLTLQMDNIVKLEERETKSILYSEKIKKEKYEKERNLINANLSSIAKYMSGSAENQDELNQNFIEKNKGKYDVLKNLDAAGWVALNAETDKGIAARVDMLEDMFDEETERWITNDQILAEIQTQTNNKLMALAIDLEQQRSDQVKRGVQIQMETLDTGFESIFRKNKAFREKLKEQAEVDQELNEARIISGAISAEEGAANRLAIAKKLSDDLNKMEDQRLNKIKEVYTQISNTVLEFTANRAAAESQAVTENADQNMQTEQDRFDRQLEIAQKAGIDTVGMQKAHDQKMRGLETQKADALKEIQRKQFKVQKANDIIMALINGALAITKVTAQTGIGAIVAAPMTSALIAAQIASIVSRKFVGEKGGITPDLSHFATGGMVSGPSHQQGGVKFQSGGRVVELEGGEAVINRRSTALFRPQLSAMNSHGGFGKKFAEGGLTPGMRSTMESAKGNWTAKDIAGLISGSINAQQVFVTEADISTSQSVVDIIEGHSSIF